MGVENHLSSQKQVWEPYPGRAVGGATSGKKKFDNVQVVVMDSHMQRSQAVLKRGRGEECEQLHHLRGTQSTLHPTTRLPQEVPTLTWPYSSVIKHLPACSNDDFHFITTKVKTNPFHLRLGMQLNSREVAWHIFSVLGSIVNIVKEYCN